MITESPEQAKSLHVRALGTAVLHAGEVNCIAGISPAGADAVLRVKEVFGGVEIISHKNIQSLQDVELRGTELSSNFF